MVNYFLTMTDEIYFRILTTCFFRITSTLSISNINCQNFINLFFQIRPEINLDQDQSKLCYGIHTSNS